MRDFVKTLIIDNYDSFTFNLFQMIASINGVMPVVVRNDQVSWAELAELGFDNIVISPGPGNPSKAEDFGICGDAILYADVPILGVCLGHQGIGHIYGGTVKHAPEPMHGRTSTVIHSGSPLFAGIPNEFEVVRYHSLLVEDPLPDVLEKTAWTRDGIIMGLRHRDRPIWGVQFHPESICTTYGDTLLRNFRDLTIAYRAPSETGVPLRPLSVVPPPGPQSSGPARFEVRSRKIESFVDPENAFVHLFSREPFCFWLDSSRFETGLSRFSYMGAAGGPLSSSVTYRVASQELTITEGGVSAKRRESIHDYLEAQTVLRHATSKDLPFDFVGGFIGYFGYELKADGVSGFEHVGDQPDASFLFADRVLVFDHQEQAMYLVALVEVGATTSGDDERWFGEIERSLRNCPQAEPPSVPSKREPIEIRLARPRATYLKDVATCKREIGDGETYELCLTNKIRTHVHDPLIFYRRLRRMNPAPYAAFLRFPHVTIASSSPERFLRVDRERSVESKPIKGTRPRGKTPEEDERVRNELAENEKDRSENLMIVDLLRNDLGIVCEIGSVHVPTLMAVETYQTVHQLVSTVRGRLRKGQNAAACLRHAFPGGSMTGAPKLRSMRILEGIETEQRGIYSGAIGFLSVNGTADTSIVIRTLIHTPEASTIGVGGAIIALSDADAEFDETMVKADVLMRTVVLTERGSLDQEAYAGALEVLRATGSVVL